jgi:hypothetical protein
MDHHDGQHRFNHDHNCVVHFDEVVIRRRVSFLIGARKLAVPWESGMTRQFGCTLYLKILDAERYCGIMSYMLDFDGV